MREQFAVIELYADPCANEQKGFRIMQIRGTSRDDGSRIGMMESGRLGYLFPDRVVNLDGKMNTEALAALRANRLIDYLRTQKFDHLLLYGYDVSYFDRAFPTWRELYAPDDRLKSIQMFTRR